MNIAAGDGDYADRKRDRQAQRSRESFAAKAEIGPLPDVADPARKDACRTDLLKFLTTYFPNSTGINPFSDDHVRMIARLQRCILFGGKMVQAVYRGFAKTTIGENACLWAALYGHHQYIPLVGCDADAAGENLESIKLELSGNDLLYEDFPEVCHAVRALEGRTQRAASQTLGGELTQLGWTAAEIVFPTVADSESSGVCIRPMSLLSYNRGTKHKMPNGTQARPGFIFIDDPQTDESAASRGQIAKRMSKLMRTILKSAGHTGSISVYVAATIIESGDMVTQLLDPKFSPSWHGEVVKMVKSWSDAHETFWMGDYADVRNGWDRSNPDDEKRAKRDAMLLYESNREIADAGCIVSWDYCYIQREDGYEISAIQHAYNMLIDDGPDVFAAECQNEPPDRTAIGADHLEVDDVIAKARGPARRVVPAWASRLTAFIDVQPSMLWYAVGAWADDFTGCIVDYGAYPDQGRAYYTKSDIKKTIADAMPNAGLEAQIFVALDSLTGSLMNHPWRREDGASMDLDLCLIDEGFQTKTIFEFCKRSPHGSRIIPAKGDAITAKKKPFQEYEKRTGTTLGENWRRQKVGNGSIRHILHDPNYWKSWVWNRLRQPIGEPGNMTLYGAKSMNTHRMLGDHIAASELPILVSANGRSVVEWSPIPQRDNDLLDCVCGASIAASIVGCKLTAVAATKSQPRERDSKPRSRRVTGAWAR